MSGRERVSAGSGTESSPSLGRRLKTWKEIASFIGCDARTARRWEDSRGLPVRRYPNSSRSAVYAYESELRAWLESGMRIDAPTPPPDAPLTAGIPSPRAINLRRAVAALAVIFLVGAAGLAVWLVGLRSAPVESRHVPPQAAEALYRDGLYSWQTRTPVGLNRAIDDFTRAIRLDPQYAAAYMQLAISYDLIREYTSVPAGVAFSHAKAAAERAIRLDPSLGEAHAALAFAQFWWWHDGRAAEREFKTAIALTPNSALAHHWHATFLLMTAALDRALAEIDAAERLDPESGAILADKGIILAAAGHVQSAIVLLKQLEQTQPLLASPHHHLALIYKGRGDDALYLREWAQWATLRNNGADAAIAAAGLKGLAASGHAGMLKAMLSEQQALVAQGKAPAYDLARTYAEMGNTRGALRSLELSLSNHETDSPALLGEADFAPLRKLPAFQRLVANSKLATASEPDK